MAKLFHTSLCLLPEMKMAKSTFEISRGLMLAGEKRIRKGICLVMPSTKDARFGASVTMLFCLHALQIIFVNSKYEVVDKVTLKAWLPNYTPKAACRYVIESWPGTFDKVHVGDVVEIKTRTKK
ncbi:DUF192 domain-containing protein [Candidatus Woesearchaeota archaeon]|nr:DUF192 domain-containing protein [Nanoarchaeota archaeon]MCB9370622.1 DUF192 domain-containing protein [Candidatus Woesearchaeota archaeon]USN43706.1 MAG: DUF192 domain-containing protein [Candidatus Woesearchaeota archaeon]